MKTKEKRTEKKRDETSSRRRQLITVWGEWTETLRDGESAAESARILVDRGRRGSLFGRRRGSQRPPMPQPSQRARIAVQGVSGRATRRRRSQARVVAGGGDVGGGERAPALSASVGFASRGGGRRKLHSFDLWIEIRLVVLNRKKCLN